MKRNTIVKVSRSALSNNLEVIKNCLRPGVKVMAVIKANAYGHGIVEVAVELVDRVDWFAVNSVEEGVKLRKGGIKIPILVFEVPRKDVSGAYLTFDLTATVSAFDHFSLLAPGTTYHLNFDTGMGRLGLLPKQVQQVKQQRALYEDLNCVGIYSHFATADSPHSQKALEQLECFKTIQKEFGNALLTHMCNTGGSVFYPGAHFDMVRVGIGLYGYSPGETPIPGLKPALRWDTYLAQVKQVRKGEAISYGAKWRAPENGFVGIIPVGYSDGIRRNLSGNCEVAIEGDIYPVAGMITMNYCMIYLGREEIPESTHVSIFDGKNLTAATWAQKLGTIPYEIITGIPASLPREYHG